MLKCRQVFSKYNKAKKALDRSGVIVEQKSSSLSSPFAVLVGFTRSHGDDFNWMHPTISETNQNTRYKNTCFVKNVNIKWARTNFIIRKCQNKAQNKYWWHI
jgi:hypothetical protein